MEASSLLEEYLLQLTEKEKIAYHIAKEHLKTSFSLEKSIGFQEWLKKREKPE